MFDLKIEENTKNYFKFKNKYEYSFNQKEKEDFKSLVFENLKKNKVWLSATTLIIPETGNKNLLEIAQLSNKRIITLEKNSKEIIKNELSLQPMMKSEREKLYKSLEVMESVKMAGIAGNQRKRFIEILFKKIVFQNDDSFVFFDDSLFSGYTFLAAQYQLRDIEHNNIILFDKTDDDKVLN